MCNPGGSTSAKPLPADTQAALGEPDNAGEFETVEKAKEAEEPDTSGGKTAEEQTDLRQFENSPLAREPFN